MDRLKFDKIPIWENKQSIGEISYILQSAFLSAVHMARLFDTMVPIQKLFRSGREYYSLKVISTPARGFYARLQLKRRP
jgi:hypothetical protein